MADSDYWDKLWTQHPGARVNNFARRALKQIRSRNLKTILDIGSGGGQDSRYFARNGLQVTALDLASSSLERLHASDNRIACIQQDICRMDFAKASFDAVYSHLSLQYFDDPQTRLIFYNIQGILKPGGLFFVKCKSVDDRLFGQGEKIGENMFFNQHLRHFFSKEYMAAMLAGFTVLTIRRTSSVYGRYPSSFIEGVATK